MPVLESTHSCPASGLSSVERARLAVGRETRVEAQRNTLRDMSWSLFSMRDSTGRVSDFAPLFSSPISPDSLALSPFFHMSDFGPTFPVSPFASPPSVSPAYPPSFLILPPVSRTLPHTPSIVSPPHFFDPGTKPAHHQVAPLNSPKTPISRNHPATIRHANPRPP